MEAKDLQIFLLVQSTKPLGVVEELGSGPLKVSLRYTPHVAKIRQDASLAAEYFDGSFLGDVGQANDTV